MSEFDTSTVFVADCLGITLSMTGFAWYNGLVCSTLFYSVLQLTALYNGLPCPAGSSKPPEFIWLTGGRDASSKEDLVAVTEPWVTDGMEELENLRRGVGPIDVTFD